MKAKLVSVSPMTRVIVPDDMQDHDIIARARIQFIKKLKDELYDNVEDVKDDEECPYDPEYDKYDPKYEPWADIVKMMYLFK